MSELTMVCLTVYFDNFKQTRNITNRYKVHDLILTEFGFISTPFISRYIIIEDLDPGDKVMLSLLGHLIIELPDNALENDKHINGRYNNIPYKVISKVREQH
jgi:hypothetical protein